MPEVARRAGIGLAARGSVSDVVEWAERLARPVSPRGALSGSPFLAFAVLVGIYLTTQSGWPVVALGLIGVYVYAAPPFQYKYRARGAAPRMPGDGGVLTVFGSNYVVADSSGLASRWEVA